VQSVNEACGVCIQEWAIYVSCLGANILPWDGRNMIVVMLIMTKLAIIVGKMLLLWK
jgi:hypothetical protein